MRRSAKLVLGACVLGAPLLGTAGSAWAKGFADQVISYTPGTAVEKDPEVASYTTSAAALGKPSDRNNQPYPDWGFTDTSFVTPYSAQSTYTELTGIGAGGSLVLHLATPAETTGKTLGVHSGVGLGYNFVTSRCKNPADNFTDPRTAVVSVAYTLGNWVSLGTVNFELPTNYYAQGISDPLGGSTPGTVEADFFKPFTGQLSDFSDQDWAGTLAVLNGSAGGTWLDLSGTGLPAVNYVKFDVPSDAAANMYVDAVVSVPEPAAMGLLALAALAGLLRRR